MSETSIASVKSPKFLPVLKVFVSRDPRSLTGFLKLLYVTAVSLIYRYQTEPHVLLCPVNSSPRKNDPIQKCLIKPRNFCSKSNQMHQLFKFLCFGITLYMFRTVYVSIIRSSRLYIQQQVYVKQVLLPAC
jgi:hypothetical protein